MIAQDTHLLRKVDVLSDGEVAVEERVVIVRDDDGDGVGVARFEGPGDVVAGHLDPTAAVSSVLRHSRQENPHGRTSRNPGWGQ